MTKSFTPTNKLHRQRGTRRAKRHARPGLESLEARGVLSDLNPYLQTNLVSDVPGLAQITDLSAFLVNGMPAHFIFANLNSTISVWNGGTTAQVEWTTPEEAWGEAWGQTPTGCDCLLL